MTDTLHISVAALLCARHIDGGRKVLFVRAYDKHHFGFPGGKIDEGETPEQALSRELEEEINVVTQEIRSCRTLVGATPDERPMTMHLFEGDISGHPVIGAEIEEYRWLSLDEITVLDSQMTSMTRQALPYIESILSA